MFKHYVILATGAIILSAGCLSFCMISIGKNDFKRYEELMALNLLCKDDSLSLFSKHAGEKVVKEIWAAGLHTRIRSPYSHISISRDNHEIKIVERLFDIDCLMQEELFFSLPDGREVVKRESDIFVLRKGDPAQQDDRIDPAVCPMKPMQTVRCIHAKEACYDYKNQTLTAENVELETFHLPGHELPEAITDEISPIMAGVAQGIEMTRKTGEAFDFRASKLKMTFDAKKKM